MLFPPVFDVDNLNGRNGFTLTSSSSIFGNPVAGTGDINGDGKPDLIVGTSVLNKTFVVFGATEFPATLDTSSLNGANGFTLTSSSNGFGSSVAGTDDINGDGKPDLIVGAAGLPRPNKAFVVFGAAKFPATLDTSSLNGENGFTLTSSSSGFGYPVAGTGDINGDDKPDLIVGTYEAQKAFVIFGATNFPSTLDTSSLNGKNGFTLTSSIRGFGHSVAGTGDINGDGKPDLIVGTWFGYSSPWYTKEAFVVFGAAKFPATLDISSLNGENGFTLTSYGSSGDFGFQWQVQAISMATANLI